MARSKNTKLVFSTEFGRACPECGNPVDQCICKEDTGIPEGDGIVRISRETKGRKGKGVTLVTGIPLALDDLKKLAKELKQKCGTGGSLKDRVVEIQGDQRDLLVELLKVKGFQVKKSGG
ncbi:translation initiation factor Sui1 [Litoribacillus peritrichatus]|uniref:Translation initiation factor Sui1 n=1 Tax=Litoribacillus peritrichatus TaxID=718191 RepID=A0ABP7M9H3_9GAMM